MSLAHFFGVSADPVLPRVEQITAPRSNVLAVPAARLERLPPEGEEHPRVQRRHVDRHEFPAPGAPVVAPSSGWPAQDESQTAEHDRPKREAHRADPQEPPGVAGRGPEMGYPVRRGSRGMNPFVSRLSEAATTTRRKSGTRPSSRKTVARR